MHQLIRHSVRSVLRFLLNRIGKVLAYPVRKQLASFEIATHRPQEVQQALLRDILAYQAETDFGREHHFASIRTAADFQKHLPVAPYEYFEPYLERVRQGDTRALLANPRIHMFALTSGTTAARKYIPVTDEYLASYRRGWNIWGLRLFQQHPEIKLRPIVQMSGDWDEYRAPSGIPCGSVTGLTARMQKRLIRWLYCVPPSVGRIHDPLAKYYAALLLSLPRAVTLLVAANPSTVINLARTGDQHKEALLRDLRDGTLSAHLDIPDEVRKDLGPRLRKHPERTRELEEIIRQTGTLYPRDYWPSVLLLGNWMGGSVGAYLRQYPRYLGERVIRDVGLIASEGRMTIPMSDHTPAGVLDLVSHYFEFIPEGEEGSPHPTVLGAHELQEGGCYYILLTTAYGLYRYHIHDLVRVTGFHNQTPLIEFLSKGSHFSSLTGEKLSEYQVAQAMVDALAQLDLTLSTYSLAPCWEEDQPYYGLFLEQGDLTHPDRGGPGGQERGSRLAAVLDERLHTLNVEYAAKRSSQRLGQIRVEWLRTGAWAQWDRARLERTGGTLEQYKHPCLISDLNFRARMLAESLSPQHASR